MQLTQAMKLKEIELIIQSSVQILYDLADR